jgi:hypothetical protein
MTKDRLFFILHMLAIVGVTAAAVLAMGYLVHDVKRFLDQRDKAMDIDMAWKNAQYLLQLHGVHCEGS